MKDAVCFMGTIKGVHQGNVFPRLSVVPFQMSATLSIVSFGDTVPVDCPSRPQWQSECDDWYNIAKVVWD